MKKSRRPSPDPDHLSSIADHYEHRICPDRASFDVLDWASPRSQEKRFRVLADNVDLAGKRLLDVGCGLGDLWAYLRRRGLGVDYTGVDVLEKMVAEAARRNPGGRFIRADLFADSPSDPGSFDVAFCSGMFNLNLGNNHEFLASAMGRLWPLVTEALVVNLLHARAAFGVQDKYFHFDPADVLAMAGQLPGEPDLDVIDDYLPNDFTVIVRRIGQG